MYTFYFRFKKVQEQDKLPDVKQQPPCGNRKKSNVLPQMRGRVHNQREHHIILTKYEAVHPIAISENYSLSGMLNFDKSPNIIWNKDQIRK